MIEILRRELTFDSCSKGERIFTRVDEPVDRTQVRAVLQIAHGMAEHSLCYQAFSEYMARHGYAVAANDHLGHGRSVSTGGAYGYFGEGGCRNLVDDMEKLTQLMRQDYPDLPYFVLGHSMGSFLTRSYLAHYGAGVTAAALLGTGCGPAPLVLSAQLRLADHIVRKKGPLAHDALFAECSTERFNKAFAPNRTENDWLSRDAKEVDRYTADPLCGFPLTVSGYRDILRLQREIEQPACYAAIPRIPILLLSGDRDPVGNFGKGVRRVAGELERAGRPVTLKLYPGARHALLSETNRDEVMQEIRRFFDGVLDRMEGAGGDE